jgi:hypothetical protein
VGRRPHALDDRREVCDVLADAALRRQALALAVAAPVVDDDSKALREAGDDERPLHVVGPGAVDEHERVAGAELLEEQFDAVDGFGGHGVPKG